MAVAMMVTRQRVLACSFGLVIGGYVLGLLAWWALPIYFPALVIRYSPSFDWAVTVYAEHIPGYEGEFAERVSRDKRYSARTLLSYLQSPREKIRMAAVKGLIYCAGPAETADLCAAMEDGSEKICVYVAMALASYRDRAMVAPLIERLWRSDDYLAYYIIEALRVQMLTDEELRMLQPRASRIGLGELRLL